MTRVPTTVPAGEEHDRPVPLSQDAGRQARGSAPSDAGVAHGEGLRLA